MCLNFTCSSVCYSDLFILILDARMHQTSNNLSFHCTVLSLSCTCALVKTLLESWLSTEMANKSAFSGKKKSSKPGEQASGGRESEKNERVKEGEKRGEATGEATTMGGREREKVRD